MRNLFWPGKGFCVDNKRDMIWFATYHESFLCGYSLHTEKMVRVRCVSEYSSKIAFAFSDVFLVEENYLVLVPGNAKSVAVYDIEKDAFEDYPLDDENIHYNKYHPFIG